MSVFLIDLISAIIVLTGAGSAEEISESEYERFEQLSRHPVPVNLASRSRLLSSGLFSEYQIAAIEDYRSRNGDILGKTEFALLDGIGPVAAEALEPFVSFESARAPGMRESRRLRQSLTVREGLRRKTSGGESETARAEGAKYHMQIGERAELFLSARNSYSAQEFGPGTLSLAFYSRRGVRVVVGDFAARFGQGLALWSGLSMSGFGGIAAFRRNAGGFAPTGSFSPVFRGVAGDASLGRWTMGAGLATKEGETVPMAFISYLGHMGSVSVQGLAPGLVSLSWIRGFGHWTLFGESAQDPSKDLAVLAGALWAPSYSLRFAALLRNYPAGYDAPYAGAARSASKVCDERGVSLGVQWRWAECTLDAAAHPEKQTAHYKAIMSLCPEIRLGKVTLAPSLRVTERFRPQDRLRWRHEARADLRVGFGPFGAACRADVVRCRALGALAYAELSYRDQSDRKYRFSSSLRATVFRADSWDDRIYCYERDVPGAFSVPVYYKRGMAFSALAGLKMGNRHSLYLKVSVLDSASEMKIQYQLSL